MGHSGTVKKRIARELDEPLNIHSIKHITFDKIILGTARVHFETKNKKFEIVRSLCDNGSQVNLITSEVIAKLQIKPNSNKTSFIGMGGNSLGSSFGTVTLNLKIPHTDKFITAEFHVVRKITNYSPNTEKHEWRKIQNHLADAKYNFPGKIHALLGISIWIQIVEPEIIRAQNQNAMAQKTKLGYVIFEATDDPYQLEKPYIGSILEQNSVNELNSQIQKLWEIENMISTKFLTNEQKECEQFFEKTHTRDDSGRYMVRIPFNEKIQELGKSKNLALKQFFAMESKMRQNKEFGDRYKLFMKEYETLGHMEKIWENREEGYYTPHHAVYSAEKFRTVFNASAKTSTGITLNDTQLVGEKLQRDLFFILMNFRKFRYGITADIEKMYRQVLIHPADRKYQKIMWRENPMEPIRVYQLKTVTYGHACAPHCAVRALIQCANDNEKQYPTGASIIRNCFYVDDLISGADTSTQIQKIKEDVTNLLGKGGFNITKWKTNGETDEEIKLEDPEAKSVLGLYWNVKQDLFSFKMQIDEDDDNQQWTKRRILSKIGRLYDPNGFLGPVILRAKIIVQDLWREQIDWDEEIPFHTKEKWNKFNHELKSINKIFINRWMGTTEASQIELHGFCDASELGYGAIIYCRIKDSNNKYRITLLASKSRVAPLKITTIPRLELCAANLLSELMATIKPLFEGQTVKIFNWSDSRIILCWLKKSPTNLKMFVANRIANIQEKTDEQQMTWRWISGKENPADLISRGTTVDELIDNQLWWRGPKWLGESKNNWPHHQINLQGENEDELILKEIKIHLIETNESNNLLQRGKWFKHQEGNQTIFPLIACYGDWYKLKRVTATFLRAWRNFKVPILRKNTEQPINRNTGFLSGLELLEAEDLIIREDQQFTFNKNVETLARDKRGKIGNLAVIWDAELKFIRIDGRIRSEFLSKDEQYPILLSKSGIIAKLLVRDAHQKLHHAGNQLITQYLRGKYWITGIRILCKNCTRRCTICFKQRARFAQQLMAPLPLYRTTPARAFLHTGIDYAGPFIIRPNLLRGRHTTLKAYLAVFVCMVTRAIHLELVSDATTAAFIAALKRVISRRGLINTIVTDNGTNFVGANNYLKQIAEINNNNADKIASKFNLKWNFITPRAPHHGGIYEAAVKSAKHHITRVIGDEHLTFEEFSTILCQIEACLNSRPISPLSNDPTDLIALTPGHFLIGEPLIGIPDGEKLTDKGHWKTRWEHLQFMVQNFWTRWKNEYLSNLINRSKWNEVNRNFKIGDLVIVKEENIRPGDWKMARITEIFPDRENMVRSVRLMIISDFVNGKAIKTYYNRPITKLALLAPIEEQGV